MESQKEQTFEKIEAKNLERSTQRTRRGYLYRTRNRSQVSFECLEKMFCNQSLCDVVLESQGRELRAHKVILAASSTFFYNKFVRNANLDLPKRISIMYIDFETLSAVVGFFYKSEIDIGEDNVEHLLAAAYNLAVKDLQEACWDFLQGNLSVRTCIDTVQMARRYQSESLSTVACRYLAENFSEVAEGGKHLQMDHSEFSELIGRNVTCSPQAMLDHVILWVRFDFEQRRRYFCSLIDHIDLSLVSHEDILKKIDEETWLQNEPGFMLKYMKSLKIERPLAPPANSAKSSKLLVVVGIAKENIISIETYDFADKVWLTRLKATDNIHYKNTRLTIHGKTIYCYHGQQRKWKSAIINCDTTQIAFVENEEYFDNEYRTWFQTCAVDNLIYVAGGWGKLCTAKSYDVSSRQSKRIGSMLEGRYQLGLGTLNGLLYAVGGATGQHEYSTSMECYDPKSDSWQAMPPLLLSRCDPGVGALSNELFVVGGACRSEPRREVEAFDPVSQTWRRLPDLNVARRSPGVIAVEDKLFAIGGSAQDHCVQLNSVEIYDPESNSWSLLPTPMNTPKTFVSAALIDK